MCPMKSGTSNTQRLTALVAAIAVAVVCVAPVVTASLRAEQQLLIEQFAAFKQQHGKTYATIEEEAHRLRVFKENMVRAKVMNAANPHATFGVTPFSDLTPEEFRMRYANGAKYFEAALRNAKPAVNVTGKAPSSADWRQRGAVTEVKNQGHCGSCWAFATIGTIESQVKIAGGELIQLSEQHLVSCDTNDNGCNGGLMDRAVNYIVNSNNGVVYTEESYKYESANRYVPPCNTEGRKAGATVTDHKILPQDEDEIAAYVAENGPVGIAIDASSLGQYNGGVVTQCSAVEVNHGVLLVGYTDTDDTPHWVIKNSWGTAWGEQGYLRIQKGENTCLVKNFAVGIIAGKPSKSA